MPTPAQSLNAWIFVGEDDPEDTTYFSPNSSYQSAVRNGVYRSADMVNICFFNTVPTGPGTVPSSSQAQGYTIQIAGADDIHPKGAPSGPTTQQYLEQFIRDARAQNPAIRLLVTPVWGDADTIARIFSTPGWPPAKCAQTFAANLVTFLQHYGLNGLDIDWESPLSYGTSPDQLNALLAAVKAEYAKNAPRLYYLTMSPVTTENLTGTVINANVDFLNLQLYGGAEPSWFTGPPYNINPVLLAYGAKFESRDQFDLRAYQNAQEAYAGYRAGNYKNMTQWRLNSGNFPYEQAQQMILYQLVYGLPGDSFDDTPIIATAMNAPISRLVVRAGDVIDAIQATNTGIVLGVPQSYELLQHGGNGGQAHVQDVSATDPIVTMSGYTGTWFGWNVVVQLRFTTRGGATFGPYGSMNYVTEKTPFSVTAPPGQSIVAFSGRTVVVPEVVGTSAVIASLQARFG